MMINAMNFPTSAILTSVALTLSASTGAMAGERQSDPMSLNRLANPELSRALGVRPIDQDNPPPIYWCNWRSPKSCFAHASDCSEANAGKPCFLHIDDDPFVAGGPRNSDPEIEAMLASRAPAPIYAPVQRHWVTPHEKCTSQDGTKSGYVSDGEGGRRCEYFVSQPRGTKPRMQQQ